MGVKYNHKFVTGLMATAMLTLPAAAQAQSKLVIEDFVGTINWTQSSGGITVDVIRGEGELDVRKKGGGQLQVFGEYNRLNVIQCKGSNKIKKISVGIKKAYKSLDEYPALNIALPENAEVILQNSVPFIYGQPSLKSFDAAPRGCGSVEVGHVSERLEVKMGGSTDFTALNVGQADIKLSGSSDMRVRDIGALDVHLSGASKFKGENAQSLKANLSGSSRLSLGDIDGLAELQLSGSSESQIGGVANGFEYNGSGASDTVVNRVVGPVSIRVSGASDVNIKGGQANPMKVIASGASDVRFKGFASNLEVKASGASDISVDEVSGSLKQSRSGAADINIKRYKDATSEE